MQFTILEALKEIASFFPHLDLAKLEGIKYDDDCKHKFILTFGRYSILINLDDCTHQKIE